MGKRYTVSDGKLVLSLEEAEEGGFVVTSPLDPSLITEAETVAEAFVNARDAIKSLSASRAKLLRKLPIASLTDLSKGLPSKGRMIVRGWIRG